MTVRTAAPGQPLYEPAPFYVLRAPALSTDVYRRTAPGPGTGTPAWEADLLRTAALPAVRHALRLASPSLADAVTHRLTGTDPSDGTAGAAESRRRARTRAALLRYVTRMSTRPTPFGAFAGVSVGRFADSSTERLGATALAAVRTRADSGWLLGVIERIEQDETLRAGLPVHVNGACQVVAGRLVLPQADVYGRRDVRRATVRISRPVAAVLGLAAEPIALGDLHTKLAAEFPQAGPQRIGALLGRLWESHFLVGALRPSPTDPDPTRSLRDAVGRLPGGEAFNAALDEVLARTADLDRAAPADADDALRALHRSQHALCDTTPAAQADARLATVGRTLHRDVARAAADAAEILLRLGRFPHGHDHLSAYRDAFLERYGIGAQVPVEELLSPETGLGPPATYTEPRPVRPPTPSAPTREQERDDILLRIVSNAVNSRTAEVELTDDLVARLTRWSPADSPAPPALDVFLQLHARSREDLDRGDWRAVLGVTPLAPGGRSLSRFHDLLDEAELSALRALYDAEARAEGALPVELSYLPSAGRAGNVALHPVVRPYEIAVNVAPSVPADRVLPLSDLTVGVEGGRFVVRSRRLGRELAIGQSHMLTAMQAPNVCRFLLEVAEDARPLPSVFHWGGVGKAPFLPRLVRDRIVLSPAQWNVTDNTVVPEGEGSEDERWFRGVRRWRREWRVPRHVYLVEFDNRLLLDLEHPSFAAELAAQLRKARGQGRQRVTVQEMLPDFDHLWLRDETGAPYLSEVIVPVVTKGTRGAPADAAPSRTLAPADRRCLPGGDWAYLKLYGTPEQLEHLVSGRVPGLVQGLADDGLLDRWFWMRYADPDHHLRLRLRGITPEAGEEVLTRALRWAREAADAEGLSAVAVDTYRPETERYGGPAALAAMERAFGADSTVCAAVLGDARSAEPGPDRLAEATFTLDRLFAHWGLDPAQRLALAADLSDGHRADDTVRGLVRRVGLRIAAADRPAPAGPGDRTPPPDLLRPYADLLPAAAAAADRLHRAGELWRPPREIHASLAHMHANRLFGIAREWENRMYTLWAQALRAAAHLGAAADGAPAGTAREKRSVETA
ncbi:lantibiotic dehydratase [Streptomyces sp. I05A-00742]|uniref:lantibiotic dehydratase n=1 Tax=Streptomyces sp. I05A-00742 TaxID=2732853 RepID=UPI001488F19A|nr:lantibiotic dehydratase [Streptomyces sp. I05A-00742]